MLVELGQYLNDCCKKHKILTIYQGAHSKDMPNVYRYVILYQHMGKGKGKAEEISAALSRLTEQFELKLIDCSGRHSIQSNIEWKIDFLTEDNKYKAAALLKLNGYTI